MNAMDITELGDLQLEIWFAKAGLAVEVVPRCPLPTCVLCADPTDGRRAEAA